MDRLVNDSLKALAGLAVSASITLIATPVLRNVCRRSGWLDRPDGARKIHPVAVPPSGGLAIMLGLPAGGAFFGAIPAMVWMGAALMLAVGLADDAFSLRPWWKLALQTVAAGLVVLQAIRPPDALTALAAILWLLLCANAFNLLDGLDGLASSAGLIAAVALLYLRPASAPILAPLAAGLAGFLVFNLPPASVFLGDSGSLLIGFLLGWAALTGQPTGKVLGPAVVLALPFADTAFTLGRRLVRGQPLFRADRTHIHHHLLGYVRSPRSALLWLTAASIGTALAGVALDSALGSPR